MYTNKGDLTSFICANRPDFEGTIEQEGKEHSATVVTS
jgi:hypothetical protein